MLLETERSKYNDRVGYFHIRCYSSYCCQSWHSPARILRKNIKYKLTTIYKNNSRERNKMNHEKYLVTDTFEEFELCNTKEEATKIATNITSDEDIYIYEVKCIGTVNVPWNGDHIVTWY